ncbi:uncharacterized protein LOC111710351 [Eurytemora carolleeae]|uniref:uncharacterized protein LOC111710351 n=1 Tax=Eurytemora carolleeae TaxID=1294199 RepID=UPI000C7950FC|nr:uncharacterized protein LOC111710351 [Eurytemora carolleeae]|eukprot:XP_023340180.1 uncharacterized protein LOC111710351 [Eurytemora affinis]
MSIYSAAGSSSSFESSGLYSEWQYKVTERAVLVKTIEVFDENIQTFLSSLPSEVEDARQTKEEETLTNNRRQLGYFIGVTIGWVLGILAELNGQDLKTIPVPDWLFHAGTAFYGYGFSGYYLLEGQLDDPDPGCGVPDLTSTLDRFPALSQLPGTYSNLAAQDGTRDPYQILQPKHLPAMLQFQLKILLEELRVSLSCISSSLESVFSKLNSLVQKRLSLTQDLLDILHQESKIATSLGYSSI